MLSTPNATPARFSATTVIACVALALSGCAVGILLGRWTASPAPVSEHSVEAAAAQPDMRPLLEEIRRAIEALPQAMRDRHDPQPAGARESAVASPETFDRLTAAVEELNKLLARGALGSGAGSTPTDVAKGPGFPSVEALWQKVDSVFVSSDADSPGKIATELTRAHLLWTNEDLVQRYGASSYLGQAGSFLQPTYRRPREASRANEVTFQLSYGVVVRVMAE